MPVIPVQAKARARLLQLGRVVDLSIEEVPVEEIIRVVFHAARQEEAQP